MKKKWIPLLIVAVCLIGALILGSRLYGSLSRTAGPESSVPAVTPAPAGGEADADPPPSPEEDRIAAPDFTVYDFDGEAVSLSGFLGTPVVINFWATWCPPCRSELPAFQSAWEVWGDRVQFLMVDLTDGGRETEEAVLDFLAETGYTFPVFCDSDYSGAMAYGVRSIPMTVFVDAEGLIRGGQIGAMTEDALTAGLENLLNK